MLRVKAPKNGCSSGLYLTILGLQRTRRDAEKRIVLRYCPLQRTDFANSLGVTPNFALNWRENC